MKRLTLCFKRLFEAALEERQYYFNIEGTNAFRLFNAEARCRWPDN